MQGSALRSVCRPVRHGRLQCDVHMACRHHSGLAMCERQVMVTICSHHTSFPPRRHTAPVGLLPLGSQCLSRVFGMLSCTHPSSCIRCFTPFRPPPSCRTHPSGPKVLRPGVYVIADPPPPPKRKPVPAAGVGAVGNATAGANAALLPPPTPTGKNLMVSDSVGCMT
jgi:hypothetical protein